MFIHEFHFTRRKRKNRGCDLSKTFRGMLQHGPPSSSRKRSLPMLTFLADSSLKKSAKHFSIGKDGVLIIGALFLIDNQWNTVKLNLLKYMRYILQYLRKIAWLDMFWCQNESSVTRAEQNALKYKVTS